jgi:hypothetical protein
MVDDRSRTCAEAQKSIAQISLLSSGTEYGVSEGSVSLLFLFSHKGQVPTCDLLDLLSALSTPYHAFSI